METRKNKLTVEFEEASMNLGFKMKDLFTASTTM